MDDGNENKKAKGTKRKLKFENYKNSTQLENKIIQLEKNKISINSLKGNHNS